MDNLPAYAVTHLGKGYCMVQVNGTWFSCTIQGLRMLREGRLKPGARIGLAIRPKNSIESRTVGQRISDALAG